MVNHEVLVALCGLLGVSITAYIGWGRVQLEKARLGQAERELRFQRAALGFPEFVAEWDDINKQLVDLFMETEIDRFMILRAWNGQLEPRWTTAVYQLRETDQAPIAYVHWELDQAYQEAIRNIMAGRPMYFVVGEMTDSEISRVYRAEGVTASYWVHLDSFNTLDNTGRAEVYCSFATHDPELISENTQTKCRIIANRLKGLAMSFDRNEVMEALKPPP